MRPREAWLSLMKEDPREWSVDEVHREMVNREWLDPSLGRPVEAVRAAARRLVDVDRALVRVQVSSFKPANHTGNGLASFAVGAGIEVAAAALASAAR